MKKAKRFEIVSKEHSNTGAIGAVGAISVIKDVRTGVLYMYRQEGSSGGLCVMLDRDGKPLIEEQENE